MSGTPCAEMVWAEGDWRCFYTGTSLILYCENQKIMDKFTRDSWDAAELSARWRFTIREIDRIERELPSIDPHGNANVCSTPAELPEVRVRDGATA